MVRIGIPQKAAMSRIVSNLESHVTNSQILDLASGMNCTVEGSSKVKKLNALFELLWARFDRTGSESLQVAVTTLTMLAYERTLQKGAALTCRDVDAVVADMKMLGLKPGNLAKSDWRQGLPMGTDAPAPVSAPASTSVADGQRVTPLPYPEILDEIRGMLASTSISHQARGIRLEALAATVLMREGLRPHGSIRNSGEQLDGTFELQGHHYILECKWEDMPLGFPPVRDFMGKVLRKAEGTFGVVLSMSGFIASINESAGTGTRLNSVGISGPRFMSVLEGRVTFSALVGSARRLASERSHFFGFD